MLRHTGLHVRQSRMSMYRTVLAEGQPEDLITLLNRDLLVAQWPVLRMLISGAIRDVWEAAFPELAAARPAAAA
ncbi:transcriptional regulator [Streptomyces sp. 5-10]|uniref:transcriptional regulator n=1 Tax=Streptomyces sp. 5-10 TaxID=878925 RepID=UPI00168BC399|nr:transcriptional regulator [Streptomyces sp. 5-10]